MNVIFNQYSSLTVGLVIFLLLAALLVLFRKPRWQEYLALGVIAFGLISAWAVLHPTQTPLMEDAKKVQAMIGQGAPVLLEFQSPY
jgi:predicted RND superfamily exporter protein